MATDPQTVIRRFRPSNAYRTLSPLVAAALLVSAVPTSAAPPDPERVCQAGRYAAKAKYDACAQLTTSDLFAKYSYGFTGQFGVVSDTLPVWTRLGKEEVRG